MNQKTERPIWLVLSLFFLTILAGSLLMYFMKVSALTLVTLRYCSSAFLFTAA